MRCLARIGLAAAALTLAAPLAVSAQPPAKSSAKAGATGHKHRRGLFGREVLCPDCQRAKLRAEGIEMPPPPPLPSGVVMEGPACAACESGATVVSSSPAMAPGMIVESSMAEAPGHAVVGDSAPGYAVVGDPVPSSEPVPIGVVGGRPGAPVAANALAGRVAPTDRSVMPSSTTASDPFHSTRRNPPHIVSHLLGLSAIGRDFRENQERKSREKHAMIPYGAEPPKVNALPTSVVYGGR